MSLLSTIKSIATTAWGIIQTALPILQAFRRSIPAVDDAFERIEEVIKQGGHEADDFLDRNRESIIDVRRVASTGIAVLGAIIDTCDDLLAFSADDTLTPEEARHVLQDLLELRPLLHGFAEEERKVERLLRGIE